MVASIFALKEKNLSSKGCFNLSKCDRAYKKLRILFMTIKHTHTQFIKRLLKSKENI